MLIPDSNFSIPDPGSRVKKIPDPGSASKNLRIKKFLDFEGLDVLSRGLMAFAKLESPSWGSKKKWFAFIQKF
jgi:hypothetical protein